ncbi:MAG: glycosyltransferase family 9 protein [Kiritimatiellales bacterium]
MRILIVKLSSLGDLFHALPTVRALKEGLGAEIDWAVQPEYQTLVQHFDDVQNVICFPRRNLIGEGRKFFHALRSRCYDYAIDLQGLLKSGIITAAARAGKTIGPSAAREGTRIFYSAVAGKKNKHRHAVDELLDVVRFLNLPVPEIPEFAVTFPAREPLAGKINIALCPCSRAAGKNWPAERFIETAAALQKKYAATIHLIGSAADRDTGEKISGAISGAQNHTGKTSLIELGSLLKQMNLLITVDSGPMHMGAAAGIPVLALFGPTSPVRTGPYGRRCRVIESPLLQNSKKISKHTRRNDMRFIETIPADEVICAATEMLS